MMHMPVVVSRVAVHKQVDCQSSRHINKVLS